MVWDVLIPCVQPEITLVSLLIDLLTAVLGANIVCVVVMTLPIPHPALWLVRWRLEELSAVMAKFVEDAVASFCLEDDSGALLGVGLLRIIDRLILCTPIHPTNNHHKPLHRAVRPRGRARRGRRAAAAGPRPPPRRALRALPPPRGPPRGRPRRRLRPPGALPDRAGVAGPSVVDD